MHRGYSIYKMAGMRQSRPPKRPPSERLEVFVVVIRSFLCRLTAVFPLCLQNTEVTQCRIDVARLILFFTAKPILAQISAQLNHSKASLI